MQWSMPRPVLQVVAGLLALMAVGSFAMGLANAPGRGRLPGEGPGGQDTTTAIQAVEATPLGQERIEGPPPPPELTEEEKAKLEAEERAKEEAEAAAAAEKAAAELKVAPPPALPPAEKIGDSPQKAAPPPVEEPVF